VSLAVGQIVVFVGGYIDVITNPHQPFEVARLFTDRPRPYVMVRGLFDGDPWHFYIHDLKSIDCAVARAIYSSE
jgi:hypothetical protein